MPNLLATVVLYSWPIVAYLLVKNRRADESAVLLIVVPYLLLPVGIGISLPVIPTIDKNMLAAITAYVILSTTRKTTAKVQDNIVIVLIIMLFSSPFLTWLTNTDRLSFGYGTLVKDGLTAGYVFQAFFYIVPIIYIPFILGARYLRSQESHTTFVRILILAGLAYSLPMMWEVRMSPQLHSEIYGFSPADFRQQIREGGYRPMVFLGHGLYVAVFAAAAAISSLLIFKYKTVFNSGKIAKFQKWIPFYLLTVVFLCKTWSALIYCFIALGAVMLLSRNKVLLLALGIAVFVFFYPILRGVGMVPTQQIIDKIETINYERASSLRVRFENEDRLLVRGNERPLFGWGGSGRSRVRDELTGEDISITDGTWIIIFGIYGWWGYIGVFGLLAYPVFRLYRQLNSPHAKNIGLNTAIIALLLSLNMLDLLPNSSMNPLTFLFAGAVFGRTAELFRTPQKPLNAELV